MKIRFLTMMAAGCLLVAGMEAAETPVYLDKGADPTARAKDLASRMTLEEKLDYFGGTNLLYMRPLPRLGVPAIRMSDGAVGVRQFGSSTAYPAGICTAAAWDRDLAQRIGVAMGRDCRARGVHVLLGPAMNIHRAAQCGRNFEYFGEDPFLAGEMASGMVKGIQSQGVLATPKHFACNNQETDRIQYSAEVDERALREIYLPPFEAAVRQGGARCIMTAYNKVNGSFCDQNVFLLDQVLRKEWGFDGIVMCDWGMVHDPVSSFKAGMDLDMPMGRQMNARKLLPAIKRGEISEDMVNAKVERMLRTVIAAGFLDRKQENTDLPLDDPASAQVALEGARNGLVLLKNEAGALPLDARKKLKVALFGPNANRSIQSGGGASFTKAFHRTSILDGIKTVAPDWDVTLYSEEIDGDLLLNTAVYEGPVQMQLCKNRYLQNEPAVLMVSRIGLESNKPPLAVLASNAWSARWVARIKPAADGMYGFASRSDDGMRVFLDDQLLIDDWQAHPPRFNCKARRLEGGRTYKVRVEYYEVEGPSIAEFGWGAIEDPVEKAKQTARQADVAVVCAGFNPLVEGENRDRPFELPPEQTDLIRRVAEVNPKTVVVLVAGGGVAWDGWLTNVPAVLHAWYPGQEGGRAVADVLCGLVNPSGRLPVSFEKQWKDNPSAPYYLKPLDVRMHKAVYGEGVYVGYRGYDRNGVEPQFCFGHGLSYTTFAFDHLGLQTNSDGGVSVRFEVNNTGRVAGAEVAQVYVAPPDGEIDRPPQELKGFSKVFLEPGKSETVSIQLPARAFQYWHPVRKQYRINGGLHEIRVGASSRDIRIKGKVFVQGMGG